MPRRNSIRLALAFAICIQSVGTSNGEEPKKGDPKESVVLSGIVTDEDGKPIPSVLISVYCHGRLIHPSTRSDKDGKYSIKVDVNPLIMSVRYVHSEWHDGDLRLLSGKSEQVINKVLTAQRSDITAAKKLDQLLTYERIYLMESVSDLGDPAAYAKSVKAKVATIKITDEDSRTLRDKAAQVFNYFDLAPIPDLADLSLSAILEWGKGWKEQKIEGDGEFVSRLALSNMAITEISKSVVSREGGDKDILKLAQDLQTYYTKANEELQSIAKTAKEPFPDKLTADYQVKCKHFAEGDTKQLQLQYLVLIVNAHERIQEFLQRAESNVKNDEIKKFIVKSNGEKSSDSPKEIIRRAKALTDRK